MTVETVDAPYKPAPKEILKAYVDLTRAHFLLAWPLLFCSGLILAFQNYGGFSWSLTIRAALIGLLGFEAGMVGAAAMAMIELNLNQIQNLP